MLLVIDSGNSNVVFAVFDDDKVKGIWRTSTKTSQTEDEYAVWFFHLLKISNIDPSKIKAAVISNVVPSTEHSLINFCIRYFYCTPIVMGADGVNIGVGLDDGLHAHYIGSDRLANCYAAFTRHSGSHLVIDLGTATTFDIVDDEGKYYGGLIAPGISQSAQSLHEATALLPQASLLKRLDKVISTYKITESIESGVFWGFVSLIEGLIERIKKEYQMPLRVILTGGFSPLFASSTKKIDETEPNLTLIGLNEVYKLNKPIIRSSDTLASR